jgi:hypothetical protein
MLSSYSNLTMAIKYRHRNLWRLKLPYYIFSDGIYRDNLVAIKSHHRKSNMTIFLCIVATFVAIKDLFSCSGVVPFCCHLQWSLYWMDANFSEIVTVIVQYLINNRKGDHVHPFKQIYILQKSTFFSYDFLKSTKVIIYRRNYFINIIIGSFMHVYLIYIV